MLSGSIRILDFDGSLTKQSNLLKRFQPEIINFKKIGPSSRMWLNSKATQEIRFRLNQQSKDVITFFGSGDFHHISALLVEQFQQPLSVIIFDNHPDWDTLPPHLGCGSWVSYMLKNPNIKNVIILGVSSCDISERAIYSGNLGALRDNRLQLYPYSHGPTRIIFKNIPENKSIDIKKGLISKIIYWQELKDKNLSDFLGQVLNGLETQEVYVSIDKDCLKSRYALTNWEEGSLDLEELLGLLRAIKENSLILGLDVTGEYSLPKPKGMVKTICSYIDHPSEFTAKNKEESVINLTNEETNIKILEALF